MCAPGLGTGTGNQVGISNDKEFTGLGIDFQGQMQQKLKDEVEKSGTFFGETVDTGFLTNPDYDLSTEAITTIQNQPTIETKAIEAQTQASDIQLNPLPK